MNIVFDEHKLKTSMIKSVKEIKKIHEEIIEGKMSYDYGGSPVKALPCDYIRVFNHLKSKNSNDAFYSMFFSSLINAESKSIGSSIALTNYLDETNVQNSNFNRICKSDLEESLKFFVGNGMIYDSVLKIFEETGHAGSVSFDSIARKEEDKLFVRTFSYKKLNAKIQEGFNLTRFKLENAVIIFVDGSVNSMGFLDRLVNQAIINKSKIVLIAKEYNPDVVKTLDFNFSKKNYEIIPFVCNESKSTEELIGVGAYQISLENYDQIFSIDISDLKSQAILIEEDHLCLQNQEISNFKFTEVKIPQRLMKISGLIEDRILSGLAFSRAACYSGIFQNSKMKIPNSSFNTGVKISNYLKNQIKNTGCILQC